MGRLPLSTTIFSYISSIGMNGGESRVQTVHCLEVAMLGVAVETLVACTCLAVI